METEVKQEKHNNKNGLLIVLIIVSTIIISIVIIYNTEKLVEAINYQTEKEYEDVTEYYKASDYMIGAGDNGISNQPISATIQNGILKVEGKITNKTGKKLTIKDYAVINFGGYDFAANLMFEGDGTLENNAEMNITYEANISTFKNINVIPTTVYVELGAYDSYNNYHEYDIKYIISWMIY